MPAWLHRTTKTQLRSIASADLPEPIENYIEEPDYSEVAGEPTKYWVTQSFPDDAITLMSAQEQSNLLAAELVARRDALADEMDRIDSYNKFFVEILLDELTLRGDIINLMQKAAADATSLADYKARMALVSNIPTRDLPKFKTAFRNKMDI